MGTIHTRKGDCYVFTFRITVYEPTGVRVFYLDNYAESDIILVLYNVYELESGSLRSIKMYKAFNISWTVEFFTGDIDLRPIDQIRHKDDF